MLKGSKGLGDYWGGGYPNECDYFEPYTAHEVVEQTHMGVGIPKTKISTPSCTQSFKNAPHRESC